MFKTSIAALAAAPLLASGAAFAGPYVNLEATGSYPDGAYTCLLYTSPSPRDRNVSRMPSSA